MNEFSTNVNITEQVNFIWKIANKLRGPYKPEKYKDVIIPILIEQCNIVNYLDKKTKQKRITEVVTGKIDVG
ncbi:MAG: type I restriction-modification system subunit M N-terminal domain-containing protein [Terrisporobacter sp.]